MSVFKIEFDNKVKLRVDGQTVTRNPTTAEILEWHRSIERAAMSQGFNVVTWNAQGKKAANSRLVAFACNPNVTTGHETTKKELAAALSEVSIFERIIGLPALNV